jgi:uroporphyrinogen III methyltransferase/synthase
VQLLAARGAIPVVCPAIAIIHASDDALAPVLAAMASYTDVVFTSANAVAAILADRPVVAQALRTLRVVAIGPATSQTLHAHGVGVQMTPPAADSVSLAAALGDLTGRHVLLPRSDIAGDELPAALRAQGARVTTVTAYRTATADTLSELPALLDRGVGAVVFASPSAVRFSVQAAPAVAWPPIVCIGPVTAAEARRLGLSVAAIASEADSAGIVTALEHCVADDVASHSAAEAAHVRPS